MQYENHMLENKLLPFIFHYDIISKQDNPSFTAFGNWHENPEFLCFTKGSGRLQYNKQNYEVGAGDLAIINPDSFHTVQSDDHLEYYCLIVDCDFFRTNGIPIDSLTFCPIVHDYGGDAFRDLEALYRNNHALANAKIRAMVLDLMIDLTEHYLMTEGQMENFPDSIKEAAVYIKMHYNEAITIDDIVRHVGFSRAYFSREFKKSTGVTLVTYLNYIRCQRAGILLGSGGLTVGEAAAECGFSNLSYFSKTYRRLMGMLPSEVIENRSKSVAEEPENGQFHVLKNQEREF